MRLTRPTAGRLPQLIFHSTKKHIVYVVCVNHIVWCGISCEILPISPVPKGCATHGPMQGGCPSWPAALVGLTTSSSNTQYIQVAAPLKHPICCRLSKSRKCCLFLFVQKYMDPPQLSQTLLPPHTLFCLSIACELHTRLIPCLNLRLKPLHVLVNCNRSLLHS